MTQATHTTRLHEITIANNCRAH